jgi:hypothetical protein
MYIEQYLLLLILQVLNSLNFSTHAPPSVSLLSVCVHSILHDTRKDSPPEFIPTREVFRGGCAWDKTESAYHQKSSKSQSASLSRFCS